ncbi:MAG: hypothetical protein EOP06_03230 [Proteobacteria bacterium]|nr:MAG: hypothetical protein EOP06_03230 [Pseudomonadota bacterium]
MKAVDQMKADHEASAIPKFLSDPKGLRSLAAETDGNMASNIQKGGVKGAGSYLAKMAFDGLGNLSKGLHEGKIFDQDMKTAERATAFGKTVATDVANIVSEERREKSQNLELLKNAIADGIITSPESIAILSNYIADPKGDTAKAHRERSTPPLEAFIRGEANDSNDNGSQPRDASGDVKTEFDQKPKPQSDLEDDLGESWNTSKSKEKENSPKKISEKITDLKKEVEGQGELVKANQKVNVESAEDAQKAELLQREENKKEHIENLKQIKEASPSKQVTPTSLIE